METGLGGLEHELCFLSPDELFCTSSRKTLFTPPFVWKKSTPVMYVTGLISSKISTTTTTAMTTTTTAVAATITTTTAASRAGGPLLGRTEAALLLSFLRLSSSPTSFSAGVSSPFHLLATPPLHFLLALFFLSSGARESEKRAIESSCLARTSTHTCTRTRTAAKEGKGSTEQEKRGIEGSSEVVVGADAHAAHAEHAAHAVREARRVLVAVPSFLPLLLSRLLSGLRPDEVASASAPWAVHALPERAAERATTADVKNERERGNHMNRGERSKRPKPVSCPRRSGSWGGRQKPGRTRPSASARDASPES